MGMFVKILLAIVLGILLVAFLFYAKLFAIFEFDYEWSYKLTVTVETPLGERTGSTVVHVDARAVGATSRHTIYGKNYNTEATVVKLPPRSGSSKPRYLFMLIHKETGSLAQRVFGRAMRAEGQKVGFRPVDGMRAINSLPYGTTLNLPRKRYPLLVTFRNINDPASVELVKPNNLRRSFGRGYKLKSITITMTDEPANRGVVADAIPCIKAGKACNWHNLGLPYSNPLSHLNQAFIMRRSK
ncbi:MAG: hypothetical protein V3V02_05160 [Rhizobiaceae bacterium]